MHIFINMYIIHVLSYRYIYKHVHVHCVYIHVHVHVHVYIYSILCSYGNDRLYILLIKIQYSHGQLVYTCTLLAIHLLMFGSLFVIYPSSLRLSGK